MNRNHYHLTAITTPHIWFHSNKQKQRWKIRWKSWLFGPAIIDHISSLAAWPVLSFFGLGFVVLTEIFWDYENSDLKKTLFFGQKNEKPKNPKSKKQKDMTVIGSSFHFYDRKLLNSLCNSSHSDLIISIPCRSLDAVGHFSLYYQSRVIGTVAVPDSVVETTTFRLQRA